MVKEVSNRFKELLESKTLKNFLLVSLVTKEHWYTYTTLPFDVTFGEDTYYSSSALMLVDTPRNSSSVDREKFRVAVSDPDNYYARHFRSGFIGSRLDVWLGLVDPFVPNKHQFEYDDLMLAYSGGIDENSMVNDFETKSVILSGASPLANLDRRGGYPVSKSGMDQVNLKDTSFDFLYKGSKKTLKWGKIG